MKHYRQLQSSRLWRYGSYLIAFMTLCPVVAVFASWLLPISEHWSHLADHLLLKLVINSFVLLCGVVSLSFVLGVTSAWFISQYPIPGKAWLRTALVLPMAIPAYVNGFIYLGIWDYSGPIHSSLREFGVEGLLFEIRSLPGVIWILSLGLYPYVYLMSRQAFESQGARLIEAGRSLGMPIPKIFWNLAVPMAKPWILGSLALVAMETLADFGTVSIFGVDTFTTAIYKSWYGFFSPVTAAQLSSFLLVIAFAVLSFERFSRRRQSFFMPIGGGQRQLEFRRPWQGYMISLALHVLLLVGFIIPIIQLAIWSGEFFSADFPSLVAIGKNSLLVGGATAVFVVMLSLILIFGYRFFPIRKLQIASNLAILGYALPGSVLAIGVFMPLVELDNLIADAVMAVSGWDPGLIFTGGLAVLVLGLGIRFLAVGHATISSSQERTSFRIDEAAYNFGVYGLKQLRLIHLPVLWKAIAAAMVLVFIDVIKEMPLTLMTRPFGWDTLSVRIFELISEGEWERAALPSLVLVALGLIPVLIFKGEKT